MVGDLKHEKEQYTKTGANPLSKLSDTFHLKGNLEQVEHQPTLVFQIRSQCLWKLRADTSDHLMAESGPCVSDEPGGSQELGTRHLTHAFLTRLQLRPTSHYAKMHIIQIALYAAFGTGTADYGSLL